MVSWGRRPGPFAVACLGTGDLAVVVAPALPADRGLTVCRALSLGAFWLFFPNGLMRWLLLFSLFYRGAPEVPVPWRDLAEPSSPTCKVGV